MSTFRCLCIDAVFLAVVHKPVLHVIFRLRSSIVFNPLYSCLVFRLGSSLLPLFLRGGGGSSFLHSSPSLSLLLREPPFSLSQISLDGISKNSTFGTQTFSKNSTVGTQTLTAMRKFLDQAELCSRQALPCSQKTMTKGGNTEGKEDVIQAFRTLLHGCEEQWWYATQQDSVSSESEAEEVQYQPTLHAVTAQLPLEDDWEEGIPDQNRNSIYATTGFSQSWWQGSLER